MFEDHTPDTIIRPIEPLPSIREALDGCYTLSRNPRRGEDIAREDLNDRKCSWLLAATSVPESLLTEREKGFVARYRKGGIRFSDFYSRKSDIIRFCEEKKREFRQRENNQ